MSAAASPELEQKFSRAVELLSKGPPDLKQGLNLLLIAANAGHAEAERLLAIYTGAGFGMPQSWSAALDRLQRAAERGSPEARSELRFLAGEAAAPSGDWRRMRAQIDLGTWLAAPKLRVAHASPRIATVENFVSPEICDWLIARAEPKLERAIVFDADQGARIDPGRSNSAYHFRMMEKDLVFLFVQSRIAAVTERRMQDMEVPAVLHYAVGEKFLPHVDFVSAEVPGYAQQVAAIGQRVVTFLLYLSDDYEGGETEFPLLSWRHKGRKGDALFFWNVTPDGAPDRRTVHAGLPTTRGEKWVLSQWIRARQAAGLG